MGRSVLILVDTHVVVWLALEESRISKAAATAIVDARRADGLAISSVTLIELATLLSKGRVHLQVSSEAFMADVESRFIVLPITARICLRATAFPRDYPTDPMDRIIGATAIVQGLPLLTADRAIRNSRALRTIW